MLNVNNAAPINFHGYITNWDGTRGATVDKHKNWNDGLNLTEQVI